jgi:hypothetical protein
MREKRRRNAKKIKGVIKISFREEIYAEAFI